MLSSVATCTTFSVNLPKYLYFVNSISSNVTRSMGHSISNTNVFVNNLYCFVIVLSLIWVFSITLIECIYLLTVSFISAVSGQSPTDLPVTQACLGCICEAISGCNTTQVCSGDVCGPFRITWAYWSDAGKPTVNNEAPDSQTAYKNCVVDTYCAALAVQGYMQKYQQVSYLKVYYLVLGVTPTKD